MDTSRQSSPARVTAILALIAAFIVLVFVIASSLGGSGDSGNGASKPANENPGGKSAPNVYKVKSGDTLCGIAEKFSFDCDALKQLNPKLDPFSLNPGNRVKLR
jgi:LysM repeat protein